MVRCPAHEDRNPSLKLSDGMGDNEGELIVHCFAGCSWQDVKGHLRKIGVIPGMEIRRENGHPGNRGRGRALGSPPVPPPYNTNTYGPDHEDDVQARIAAALDIWRAGIGASGTAVETYLASRGITLPVPLSIRYHPALKHGPTNAHFEAMVAAVQASDHRITGIHRTFLMAGGKGKARVSEPKMALGPLGSGCVRLGPVAPAIGLAEGIESALSAMQLWGIPVWAALGSRLDQIELPPEVVEVQLFGDNGEPGHAAAEKAAEIFTGQGRRVFKRFPPENMSDWNDALSAEVWG